MSNSLIGLCVVFCIIVVSCIPAVLFVFGKKIRKKLRGHRYYFRCFKILCKYHVYDLCEKTYIDFLLKEKVKASKIIRLVKRAFPNFKDDFLKRKLLFYIQRERYIK